MRPIKSNKTSFKKGHKKVGGFVRGSKHTEQAKEKVRQSLIGKTGEQARNWQGGKTPKNLLIRYSQRAKEWRKTILKRDNYTCKLCGISGVKLHIDHIKPFSRFPQLRFAISNGRTLCVPCHEKTPTYKGRLKPCEK